MKYSVKYVYLYTEGIARELSRSGWQEGWQQVVADDDHYAKKAVAEDLAANKAHLGYKAYKITEIFEIAAPTDFKRVWQA